MDSKVHISYKWEDPGQGIVRNWLYPAINESGLLGVLDVHGCCYMHSIMDFERQFGVADIVVIVVSNAYLNSKNCLFEATSIIRNQNYRNRIILINLDNIKIESTQYEYMVSEYANLTKQFELAKNSLPKPTGSYYDEEYEQCTTILNGIADFMKMLRDYNSLNFTTLSENNFKKVIDKIKELKQRNCMEDL